MTRRKPTKVCTIISAHPRTGWLMAYKERETIVHTGLTARDLEEARAEAQARLGPEYRVLIPRLGEGWTL